MPQEAGQPAEAAAPQYSSFISRKHLQIVLAGFVLVPLLALGLMELDGPGRNWSFGVSRKPPEHIRKMAPLPPAVPEQKAAKAAASSERKKKWVFEDSQTRLLTVKDVQPLTAEELWRARNEIYARRGYVFHTDRGRVFASSLGHSYKAKEPYQETVEKRFGKIERDNVEFLRQWQVSWVFSYSNNEQLSFKDVQSLTLEDLWRAEKEILARKGVVFKDRKSKEYAKNLGKFYSACMKATENINKLLNETERYNLTLLRSVSEQR